MDHPAYPVLDPRSPAANAHAVRPGACALAMMIKAPRPGASKTRLTPPLTAVEAASLSKCFLRDTTANIAQVVRAAEANGGAPAAGVAVYTPAGMESAFHGLLPGGFVMMPQRDEPFGERLVHAVEDLFALGYGAVCLIDSDSPTLPTASLANAVESLARPGGRLVLGPSEDGGYYLIGLKKPHRQVFEEIDWSTEQVFAQTLQRAAEIGLPVDLLPTWYDVDDAPTLRTLCREFFGSDGKTGGFSAPRTREFLERLLAAEGRARLWPTPPGE
jgi:rSAM/selenodomain-associated transferase 1